MHQSQIGVRLSRRTLLTGVAAVAGALVLTACGSTATTSGSIAGSAATPTQAAGPAATSPAATPAAAASPVAAASSPAAAAAPAAGAVAQRVNANTASVAELQRAFEAAGIPSAARWAREVEEYRPYPTDDPSLAKLRRELAKYNPGPGVVDQIVATLTL